MRVSSMPKVQERLGERGAVLLEAAIAIPFLILLMFGTLETGMAWSAKAAATNGVRTGILRAASLGNKAETDLRVLQSVVGEIGPDKVDSIEYVIVFNAAPNPSFSTVDDIIAHCASQTQPATPDVAVGVQDLCVVYTAPQLAAVVSGGITITNFDDGLNPTPAGDYDCQTGGTPVKIDSYWCAGDRSTTNNPSSSVGIAVSLDHEWFTGILPGDGVTFTDHAVSSTLLGEYEGTPAAAIPFVPTSSTTSSTAPPPSSSSSSSSSSTSSTVPPPAGPPYSTNPADHTNVSFLSSPPGTISQHSGGAAPESDLNAFVFDEQQGVTLTSDLTMTNGDGSTYTIPAGTTVCSTFVFINGATNGWVAGSMTFAPGVQILGVMGDSSGLNDPAVSALLGDPSVDYSGVGDVEYGSGETVTDTTGDPQTISWNIWTANEYNDAFRVITTCP